jgi:hypothetical protein
LRWVFAAELARKRIPSAIGEAAPLLGGSDSVVRLGTAVIGEDADGLIVYNRSLIDLARHFGFYPKACRPYRAKTSGLFATSVKIYTWRAASGISMTSMPSWLTGSTP